MFKHGQIQHEEEDFSEDPQQLFLLILYKYKVTLKKKGWQH